MDKKPVVKVEMPQSPPLELQAQQINQQLIDLEMQTTDNYEMDSDEELDDL